MPNRSACPSMTSHPFLPKCILISSRLTHRFGVVIFQLFHCRSTVSQASILVACTASRSRRAFFRGCRRRILHRPSTSPHVSVDISSAFLLNTSTVPLIEDEMASMVACDAHLGLRRSPAMFSDHVCCCEFLSCVVVCVVCTSMYFRFFLEHA